MMLKTLQTGAMLVAGLIIANTQGMTTYVFDPDLKAPGTSTCYDGCAQSWPPVLSDGTAVAAPLSVIPRKDGTSQLAYQGRPLYLFAGDRTAGDKNGDGIGDVWHIAKP